MYRAMNLTENLDNLSTKIEKMKDHIGTEEATKNAFVLPLLLSLEYDVYNPLEVVPEMPCDISNKGDRVDYAIFKDGEPVMIVECKQCSKELSQFVPQLSKYYVATNARFAVLTNGIEYWFFADFDKANLMDAKPFFIFDMNNCDSEGIELLGLFSKNSLDELKIIERFTEIRLRNTLSDFINRNIMCPSDDFVEYVSKSALGEGYDKALHSVYKSTIKSLMNDFLPSPPPTEETPIISRIELRAYEIVKDVLKGKSSEIQYKKFKSYFTVNQGGSVWRWIIRLKSKHGSSIKICFPVDSYKTNEWVQIDNIESLYNMEARIMSAFKIAESL